MKHSLGHEASRLRHMPAPMMALYHAGRIGVNYPPLVWRLDFDLVGILDGKSTEDDFFEA